MRKMFTPRDYFSLFRLSLRSFFWRVDGKANLKAWMKYNISDWTMIIVTIVLLAYPVEILLFGPFSMVFCTSMGIVHLIQLEVSEAFTYLIGAVWRVPVQMIVSFLLIFNVRRFWYALHYRKSAWYRNTGHRPSEVTSDVGLYGEYIATMCEEAHLRKNGVKGYVFNSVIVPKRDGDFNEIDVLSVSTMGIHVIEAKARVGTFYGSFISPKWTQQLGSHTYEMENPIIQNSTHINYLVDYLREQVPEGFLKDSLLINTTKNIVLFTLTGIKDQLNRKFAPNMDFYYGMAESDYAKRVCNVNKLSQKEVEILAGIIREMAIHSPAEIDAMMQVRKIRQDNREFSHPYIYKTVWVKYPGDDDTYLTLCRDNGYHHSFYDRYDGIFKSYPEAQILYATASSRNLETILAKYNAGECY